MYRYPGYGFNVSFGLNWSFYGVNSSCCLVCSLPSMIVGGSLMWRADDALLYLRRLHTFGCGVNRRR